MHYALCSLSGPTRQVRQWVTASSSKDFAKKKVFLPNDDETNDDSLEENLLHSKNIFSTVYIYSLKLQTDTYFELHKT